MTVIEIRPHAWGWKAFERPGVAPVFPTKDDAISYAQTRARFRTGEIRVLDFLLALAVINAARTPCPPSHRRYKRRPWRR